MSQSHDISHLQAARHTLSIIHHFQLYIPRYTYSAADRETLVRLLLKELLFLSSAQRNVNSKKPCTIPISTLLADNSSNAQLDIREGALGSVTSPSLEHLDHTHDDGNINQSQRNACKSGEGSTRRMLLARHTPTSVQVSQLGSRAVLLATASCAA
jgi:hypothetical protein